MMLKEILIGASLASASLVAQAAYMNPENCDHFSGPYVGATGLYQSDNDKFTLIGAGKVGKDIRNLDVYAGHDGWGGGLFAGYGYVMDQTFLGAELYGNAVVGKQKLVSIGDDYYVAMKTPYSYGVTAKLGYLINPRALVYVGLGAENTQFRLSANTPKGSGDILDTHKWGIVPSIGMNLAIDCNWQVGAKLSYANYKSMDIPAYQDFKGGSVEPRRATFGINVTYHFI